MKLRTCGGILAIPMALAALAFAGEAEDAELKKLEGTWKFVSLESDGQQAPAKVIASWRWVVKGGEVTLSASEEGEQKTSLSLDASRSPKAIDLKALDGDRKGKTFKAIYELDGDRLKMCLPEGRSSEENRPRPDEFRGGAGFSILVLERVKAD